MESFIRTIIDGQFSNLSPEFQELMERLEISEEDELIEHLVSLLLNKGKADTVERAIELIDQTLQNHVIGQVDKESVKVTCSDLKHLSRTRRQIIRLKELLEMEIRGHSDLVSFGVFGTIGHKAILSLFNERLPDFEYLKSLIDVPPEQLSLLNGEGNGQINILEKREVDFEVQSQVAHMLRRKEGIPAGLMNKIKTGRQGLINLMANGFDWQTEGALARTDLINFEKLLVPVFGPLMTQLREYRRNLRQRSGYTKKKEALVDYLYYLTILSWAGALIDRCGINPGSLIIDVPALSSDYLMGGRIDALEILSVNGRTLGPGEKQVLGGIVSLLRKKRTSSIGHVIEALTRPFGSNIQPRIVELKFAAGDGVKYGEGLNENEIISKEMVLEEPLPRHRKQVLRYLTLANCDLCRVKGIDVEKWMEEIFFDRARIIYFMPDCSPLVHDVFLESKEDVEEAFLGQIVVPWVFGIQKQAFQHEQVKRLVGSVVSLAKENGDEKRQNHPEGKNNGQIPLFLNEPSEPDYLFQAINRASAPVDDFGTIHQTGWEKGRRVPVYRMHYGRLLEAIRAGKIGIGDFDFEKGGKIFCPSKKHSEKDPSFSIRLGEYCDFFCFGCGLKGKILLRSIPRNLKIEAGIGAAKRGREKLEGPDEPLITQDHIMFMQAVQEILEAEFRGSQEANEYLRKRRLDVDLAIEFGVGYGNDNVVRELLQAGFVYEQMIFYGLLGISTNVNPGSRYSACPVFREFGVKPEQLLRPHPRRKKKDGSDETGWPYLILDRRLTFPLTYIDGTIVNIYGRSIWSTDKHFIHRKMETIYSRVPHGAFNMEVLRSGEPDLVILEGVTDALTVRQMGVKNILATAGVRNKYILNEIASSSKKEIFVGFNNDPSLIVKGTERGLTGQKATASLFARLKQYGHQGKRYNLTRRFTKRYPECKSLDDFNAMYKQFGSSLSLEGFGLTMV